MLSRVASFVGAFDSVALDARRLAPARWFAAVVVIALVAANLGLVTAALWGGALLACEVWAWIATTPHASGEPLRWRHRAAYIASTICGNVTWLALSVLFWRAPELGGFFSLLIWAALLLNGISFAFRSREALYLLATPVSATMIAVPLLMPQYGGAQQALTLTGLGICAGYAWISARRNVVAAEALAAATRELAVQKQAAEAANQAKSSFLAMMSHELRTPMNGVLGMARALDMTPLDERQQGYVRTLMRSGDGLMAILNDVLDLAKIEAGRIEIEAVVFDLPGKLRKTCELWELAAAEKGLALACDLDPALPQWVSGDATRVRQIVLNLLSNAVKFTTSGEVRLTARAEGARVSISVLDTGPGMDDATQGRLFQGFTQADASVARRFGGTGLGLAISRDLARLMGGDIAVTSRPGEGACFTLSLPLPCAEAPAPPEPAQAPAEGRLGLRALVVDDNRANREVARALLEAVEVAVVTAPDGTAALEAMRTGAFDVVFMDIHMPGLDGIEVLRRIRRGPLAHLPVVALTADAMAGERERLLGLGFDAYLSKPIEPEALIEILSAAASSQPDLRTGTG